MIRKAAVCNHKPLLVLLAILLWLEFPVLAASETKTPRTPDQTSVCGFYLHACWDYSYPFAVRKWQRQDYRAMFQLLHRIGYNTVMLWPVTEAIPAPLSKADAAELRAFRKTISEAQKLDLQCWLARTPNLLCEPELARSPWMDRNFFPHQVVVRLDDPLAREQFFAHREAITAVLNNADAYVTIDGDPGGYAGAKPADWLAVFAADRAAIRRHGTHPKRQLVIPFLWCGWGTKGVWQEPIEPFVEAELRGFRNEWERFAPTLLLPGRSTRDGWGNGRKVIAITENQNLSQQTVIFCYEAVEFEPTPPAPVLQFADIRRIVGQEEGHLRGQVRGWFANAQQPIMVLPNLFYFQRCVADASYLRRTDEEVLRELATLLGDPTDALVTAWSCLACDLAAIPADLPARLRSTPLRGPAAKELPGGEAGYREILARAVEGRRATLLGLASQATPQTVIEAVQAIGRWWALNRYAFSQTAGDTLNWDWIHWKFVKPLREACSRQRDALQSQRGELEHTLALAAALSPDGAREAINRLLPKDATH